MSARSTAKHKPGSLLGSLLGLVGFSLVAGLLVSATVTPAIAVASSTANGGLDVFENLPEYAQIEAQSEASTIYGTLDGQSVPIAEFYSQNREIVTLPEAGQWAPLAAIAGEDRRFYDHGGVDAPSIIRAAFGQFTGGSGGASSLSMQLVRQQIVMVACEIVDVTTQEMRDEELCNDQLADSYGRKLQEMRFAIGLEQRYTKNEILLAYLNIGNFGNATYGIQAAAQRTFSVSASQLTIAQAASLLAVLQNPNALNLFTPENYERNQIRRDFIIRAMADVGYITEAQRDEALAIPVDAAFLAIQPAANGCIASYYGSTGFFCDYVQRLLTTEQPDGSYILGTDAASNANTYNLGGLQVYTSIDVGLNEDVQGVLDRYVPNTETRWESGGAVTMLEVGTGRILAMAQNKDYDTREDAPATGTSLNFNVAGQQLGGGMGFQPGSGYKIFALAAWIEAGYSVNTSLDTRDRERRVQTCNGATSPFDPQNNEGRNSTRESVTNIFVNSLNTGVVEMGTRVAVCDVFDVATRMGTTPANATNYDAEEPYPPWLIGGAGNVTPMSMAEAFQTVANGGVHCEPTAIDRIVSRDGAEIAPPERECEQAITREVASVMQLVLQEVTNRNPLNNPPGSAPVISKTGTNDNVVQTWVNGASSRIATSVWVGNIRGLQSLFSLGGRQLWDVRSTVFTQSMSAALDRYPGGAFLTPDAETVQGNAVALPDVAGQTPDEARATLEAAGLSVVVGGNVAGAREAGRVEYTSPAAGTSVLPETSITLNISDGSAFVPPVSAIPAVEGQSVADARTTMSTAGLDPANLQITWVEAPEEQRCQVLDQNPDAASPGDAASPISVTVGAAQNGQDPGGC